MLREVTTPMRKRPTRSLNDDPALRRYVEQMVDHINALQEQVRILREDNERLESILSELPSLRRPIR